MVQRIFRSLFFAMLLVFAQQAALVHGYVHTPDLKQSAQNDKQAPAGKHNDVCGQCLAAADIGGAIGSKSYVFSLDAGQHQLAVALQLSVTPAPLFSYQSRAPPLLA